ncbi:hypothetical protein N869_02345, partial [Cellulomonas bogoriensis 69B4 = DSM 16987]
MRRRPDRLTYRRLVGQAGLVVIAMTGLWLAYLVPHHLRYRRQLVESRADDRYSHGLRVVRVARSGSPSSGTSEATRGLVVLHPSSGTARAGGGVMDRPHAAGARALPDAERGVVDAERLAHLARRGAAARRRAALAGGLLVLTVVGWSVVAFTAVAAVLAVVPTVLLAGVLVLGRRAVIAAARADARWEQELLSRPPGTEAPTVVGHAARPDDSGTQLIPRVPREQER